MVIFIMLVICSTVMIVLISKIVIMNHDGDVNIAVGDAAGGDVYGDGGAIGGADVDADGGVVSDAGGGVVGDADGGVMCAQDN